MSAPAAATIQIDNVAMPGAVTVHVAMPDGINGNVRAGMFKLTDTNDQDYLGFCVDLFNNILLGNQNPVLNFSHDVLTDNFNGDIIPLSQLKTIGGLVNWGLGAMTNLDRQAAQVAIWQTLGATVTSNNSGVITRAADLLAMNLTSNGQVKIMRSIDKEAVQSIAIGAGAVPEPAVWATMIIGFGFVGVAARRRRIVVTA
jgi:hypothetical protein